MIKGTGGFESFGEFLKSVKQACDNGVMDARLKNLWVKTAGHIEEASDSQGGFLSPEQFVKETYEVALEQMIVRPRAKIVPMTTDAVNISMLFDTNRSSHIFGGITMTWLEERGDKSYNAVISKPELGKIRLVAYEGIASCYVSNQLESDVENFGDFMKQAYGGAVRFYEDDVFIHGSGVGQPLGILNSGTLIKVFRQAVGKIDWPDIKNMAKRLLPESWARAVWLINPDTLGEFFEMTASAANTVNALNMNTMMLLGRPIIITEKAQALGSIGDVILADFGSYVIGDREFIVAGTRHDPTGFVKNESFWKVVLRVDGQPIIAQPITPKRGANTLSPFVALAATTS